MGYDIATNTDILFNKNLDDFEFRLYLTIRSFCNSKGYSEVKNQKLASKFGKKPTVNKKGELKYDTYKVRTTLAKLEKNELIVVQQHVKQGKVYPRNIDRVIWLKEAFQKNADRKARAEYYKAHARPETDYKQFVAYIRDFYKGIPVTIQHSHGKTHQYSIREGHLGSSYGLLYAHYGFGHGDNEGYTELNPKASKKVYDILWENRFNLLEDPYFICIEGLSEEQEKELKRLTALSYKVTDNLIEMKAQGTSNHSPTPQEGEEKIINDVPEGAVRLVDGSLLWL